jgi:hypothetical protein
MKDEVVAVELAGGGRMLLEVTRHGSREEQVAATTSAWSLEHVSEALIGISREMGRVLTAAAPDEAEITFGVECVLETDKILALLVKGSAKSNLQVTLKWKRTPDGD